MDTEVTDVSKGSGLGTSSILAALLDSHWKLSKMIDSCFTNTLIDQIFDTVSDLLDDRMVRGAGGGGFLQVILKKGVTVDMLRVRLREVYQDSGVDV